MKDKAQKLIEKYEELEYDPDTFEPIQVTERHLEVLPRIQFNAARMPCKQTPLPRSVVLVHGIAVECAYRGELHKIIVLNSYISCKI